MTKFRPSTLLLTNHRIVEHSNARASAAHSILPKSEVGQFFLWNVISLVERSVSRWSKFCRFGVQSYVDGTKGTKTISALEPRSFVHRFPCS